jgi:hypothetical protein
MSTSLPVSSPYTAAKIEQWKKEARPDPVAQAYEQGAISTRPASAPSAKQFVATRFTPRTCRRRLTGEERAKRRERKRMLGGWSAMPDYMRRHYTEGERAALSVIAFEVKRQGQCELSIDEIGDRAGVGRTTVQNALHQARLLGHVQIIERRRRGAKSLTNIVRIISAAWLTWIKRGPSAARGLDRVQKSKNVSTTKSIDLRKEEALQETRCGSVPIRKPVPAENRFPSHNGDANGYELDASR